MLGNTERPGPRFICSQVELTLQERGQLGREGIKNTGGRKRSLWEENRGEEERSALYDGGITEEPGHLV